MVIAEYSSGTTALGGTNVLNELERERIVMWLTKKILVPVDFSAPSRRACEVGVELAETFRVPLALMHVIPVTSVSYSGVPYVPAPEYTKFVEDSARSALRDEAARLQGKGLAIETHLKIGVAWEEIIEAVKRLDVGLIVIGTHGRRGLPRAILGSVAEKVVRLSPVPVLTVHGADADAAETSAPEPRK
jgi:nucleotide-binding universal stress UspA family protein